MITVIGAGSGRADSLSLKAFNIIKNSNNIILKTEKMPLSSFLKAEGISYRTLDAIYENAEDFDQLNKEIKAFIENENDPVYVVHGSALDDTSVRELNSPTVIPGISVESSALSFMGISSDVKCYTSTEVLEGLMPTQHADVMISCIDSSFIAGDLKCILTEIYGDEYSVQLYTEDFDGNQSAKSIMLYEMDMLENYNHTTCIFLKKTDLNTAYRYDFYHLLEIVEILCSRNGCPWDSAQTHESLRSFLIEEAYEAVDAINKDDPYRLYDELGDVLYQIAIHAEIGKKYGEFDITDVTDSIARKMIHRHPSIFNPEAVDGTSWEDMKKEEKCLSSKKDVLLDIPENLASLARSEKILYKSGIKPCDRQQTIKSIAMMLENVADTEDYIGELLLKMVELAMACGIHPEPALHKRIMQFIDKFEEN
jgi:tetrapyrrole methylase family protein/MazG family protein